MECPKCGSKSTSEQVCSSCGIIFERYEVSKSIALKREREKQFASLGGGEYSSGPGLELGLPILAFILSPLLLWMLPGLTWSVCMWTHEFGHAMAAWLGGMAATPFLGWTSYGNRSWIVTLCFTTLLGLLTYKSWEKKSHFLVTVFACMFIAQMYFRFFLNQDELYCLATFMGIGGEFWISALLVIAYHYNLPKETHWPTLRYFVLFAAAFTFYHNFHLWLGVSHGKEHIPWGSLWGGHGDMDRLRDEWGWSESKITSTYLSLGYVCIAVLAMNYLAQAVCVVLKPVKK